MRTAEADLAPLLENKTIARYECSRLRAFVDPVVSVRLNVDNRAAMARLLLIACGLRSQRAARFSILAACQPFWVREDKHYMGSMFLSLIPPCH